MVKIYLRKVREGQMTIEEVPLKWRAEVQRLLDEAKVE